jgi:peptide/nickel transport system substrate-binding protein
VRHTYETTLDPDFGAPNRSLYVAIESIDTPDDHTVVLNLNTANGVPDQQHGAAADRPAARADVDAFNQRPIGTGPYQFESPGP